MSFKAFYIHGQQSSVPSSAALRSKPVGFTTYISPSPAPRNVFVQTSFCANVDQFCKKTGRQQAHNADVTEINKRDLPQYLVHMRHKINVWGNVNDYMYVWRYVI